MRRTIGSALQFGFDEKKYFLSGFESKLQYQLAW
jgi:hypothetical protein